jgi:heat shock protein HslJ
MRTILLPLLSLPVLTGSQVCAQESPLANTRWQLVAIQSMDDNTYTPADSSEYTLAFQTDQSVAIRSDCNRMTGTWAFEGASQLTFHDMAGTVALCPGDSLDERYRAQFQWVRSYVLRDGHLFLATMADGSIIEFRPAPEAPIVARVLGEALRSDDPEVVQGQILGRLFADYLARSDLEATETEISAYIADLDRTLAASLGDEAESVDDLTAEERAELLTMREDVARTMITRWKLNRSLYEEYGGRVIYQQFGPEPLDAYRAFLESRRDAGAFEFLDEEFEAAFWRYFENEAIHDFYPADEADRVFATPPWEP